MGPQKPKPVGMPVKLYMYDLSNGMAKYLSIPLLWTYIDAIWHVAIVAYGGEFYFTSDGGIQCLIVADKSEKPDEEITLGYTEKSLDELGEYIEKIAEERFFHGSYNVLSNNCIQFANCLSKFLLHGKSIPQKIIDLPEKIAVKLAEGSTFLQTVILYNRLNSSNSGLLLLSSTASSLALLSATQALPFSSLSSKSFSSPSQSSKSFSSPSQFSNRLKSLGSASNVTPECNSSGISDSLRIPVSLSHNAMRNGLRPSRSRVQHEMEVQDLHRNSTESGNHVRYGQRMTNREIKKIYLNTYRTEHS